MDSELQASLKKLIRVSIFVMVLVAVYLLFKWVFPILGTILARLPVLFLPFILAIIIAVLIEPIVEWFEKNIRLPRSWSAVFSLFIVLGSFILLLNVIISIIMNEISALYKSLVGQSDQLLNRIMQSIADIQLFYLQLNMPPQVQQTIQDALQKALLATEGLMNDLINGLLSIITALPTFFIFLVIATVATYFIVKDRRQIRAAVLDPLSSQARSKTRDVFAGLLKALTGFLKAYAILISITAMITLVSLKILGVDYVLMIALLVGLFDILPILGPGTIFIPWVIWEFMSGRAGMGISLLIVYIIISAVRQFLEPKIVGDNIGLHPLLTLISLYVGLQLGGLVGMILGPIIAVIIIASYRAGVFEGLDWRQPK